MEPNSQESLEIAAETLPPEVSMFPIALKAGAIFAGVDIAVRIFAWALDAPGGGVEQIVSLLALLGAALTGQILYKRQGLPPIGYGEALGVGILSVLVMALITMVYGFIHFNVIDPEFTTRALAAAEQAVSGLDLSEEEVETALTMQKIMLNPMILPVVALFGTLIRGIIIALITAIFTRKSGQS